MAADGRRVAAVLLALAASACCGLFAANSLIRVRTFTADSMNYVDVARRVVAGDGLVQSTGGFNQPFYLSGKLDLPSPFTAQPPGYPLAIAFLSRLGLEAADAALVVSALAYAAILALVYLLGRRIAGSAAAAVALGAAVLFVPLTHLGRAALSDCLAVALVLAFFLLLDRLLLDRRPGESMTGGPWQRFVPHRERPGARPVGRGALALFALGLLAGAAFGVRYALWPLPLIGVVALWLGGFRAPRRGRGSRASSDSRDSRDERREAALPPALAFSVGALVPMVWALARNQSVEGRLLPPSMPSVTALPESLGRAAAAVFGGWRSTALGSWPDAALLAAVLGLAGVLAIRTAWRASGRSRAPAGSRLPFLICLWAVVYMAAVVWSSTQANFDPIGVRLALPATVPLIPVFGALLAAPLPDARRCSWLPPAVLAVCLGASLVREATVWSSGRDARAVEFRSERQQWLRGHVGPGDLVVGGGTMDVPFLVPGSHAISYVGLPYTDVLSYPDLERIADRHCPDFDRLLLVVRPTVEPGGGRSDRDPSDWLGPFIADARAGRHEAYTLLEPLAAVDEARIYQVACP